MKTGCIRYGYDAALMILSHLTINNMKQFVLFVTTKQATFNFFLPPPSRGRKFFSLASLANTSPPISIFVILTLSVVIYLTIVYTMVAMIFKSEVQFLPHDAMCSRICHTCVFYRNGKYIIELFFLSWLSSIVVRKLVSAGELSLSCARLLAG